MSDYGPAAEMAVKNLGLLGRLSPRRLGAFVRGN